MNGSGTIFLSPNFRQAEFEMDAPLPADCVQSYRELCLTLLEPIRRSFGPLLITSGYRPPGANAAVHGVSNSEHIATSEYCAADFRSLTGGVAAREIFDFVRNNRYLEWGQLILEHSPSGPDIVHLSWEAIAARRMALEGATNNLEPYKEWPVATLAAPGPTVTDNGLTGES